MVIADPINFENYTGSGITGPYSFPHPFKSVNHFDVTLDGVAQTITTNYNVATTGVNPDNGQFTGANITFTSPVASGVAISIIRNTPIESELDYTTLTSFDRVKIQAREDDQTLQVIDAVARADNVVTGAVDAAVTASVAASEAAIADELAAAQAAQTAAEAARDAAQTSQTNAATSASNAASSASSASTSATNAASSETAAETAQAATEAALESLNDLTDGVFLSRVLKESSDGNNYSFTTVTGGNYLVNCGNLTLGQKVTANLFATPTNATINRFEVKAETNKEFHLDGGTKEIEGHEGTTAFVNIHCYLEVAFDEAKDKWVIYEKERI